MANVVLVIMLVIALFLIAVVLLQRSEGGALGIGGGGGGGLMTGRSAATALTKLTWGLGAAFVGASLILTILAARGTRDESVVQGVESATGEIDLLIPDLGDPLAPPSPDSSSATPFDIQLEPASPPSEGSGDEQGGVTITPSGEQAESTDSLTGDGGADAPFDIQLAPASPPSGDSGEQQGDAPADSPSEAPADSTPSTSESPSQ